MVYSVNGEHFSRRKLKKINIASAALTDYQMPETISYESVMQSNLEDIRFTTLAGVNIPYWEESITASTSADVWMKIPSISNSVPTYVWQYYGNPNVSSAGDGDTVFPELFDDFPGSSLDLSKWDVDTGTPVISDGLSLDNGDYIISDATMSNSAIFECSVNQPNEFGSTTYMTAGFYNHLNDDGVHFNSFFNWDIYCANSGAHRTNISSWAGAKKLKIKKNAGTNSKIYIDDSLETTETVDQFNGGVPVILRKVGSNALTVDWVFVRQYTAIEPTWAADGNEQHQRKVPSFIN